MFGKSQTLSEQRLARVLDVSFSEKVLLNSVVDSEYDYDEPGTETIGGIYQTTLRENYTVKLKDGTDWSHHRPLPQYTSDLSAVEDSLRNRYPQIEMTINRSKGLYKVTLRLDSLQASSESVSLSEALVRASIGLF